MINTPLPEKMQAVQLVGHGGFEKLVFNNSLPLPECGEYQVLIQVEAAALNNTDINTRIGWYSKNQGASEDASWSGNAIQFPRIQGIDACGTIVRVGSKVEASRIGQRVLVEPCIREFAGKRLEQAWFLGSECDGGFAEYLALDARHAFAVKSDYSSCELATFPCSYSTAENMLTRCKLVAGQKVLISGASGGVGSAAVQLAKARGAFVIALSGAAKRESLLDIGADQVLFREKSLLAQVAANSLDVVVDLVGGENWPELLEILRPCGSYVVSGAIGGAMVPLDLRTLYLKDLQFFGCTLLEDGVFARLIQLIESKKIRPLLAATYPLQEIVAAQKAFLQKKHIGKISVAVRDCVEKY